MNGWILHKKELGEVYETDTLVEEFENKCAKMNFTREQIVEQRKNYEDLRDKSLIFIDEINEISLNKK